MLTKSRNKNSWTGVHPWVLIGAVAVLLPIFTFMTIENIKRQKKKSIQLLLEKGAALIRSFEAGTRTGMMGMQRGGFQLQRLLTEIGVIDAAHAVLFTQANLSFAGSKGLGVGLLWDSVCV